MKSRTYFSFAAIVALVLIFSSVPASATERRDPLMIQEMPPTTSTRTAEPSKKPVNHKKAVQHAKHKVHSSKTASQKTGSAK